MSKLSRSTQEVTMVRTEVVLGMDCTVLNKGRTKYYILDDGKSDLYSMLDIIDTFFGVYDTDRFTEVRNGEHVSICNKPSGGLWTSPATEAGSLWIDYIAKELCYTTTANLYRVEPTEFLDNKILVVTPSRVKDLPMDERVSASLVKRLTEAGFGIPIDFEELAVEFDAVRMVNGANKWDIDSTVWLNNYAFDISLIQTDITIIPEDY